MRTCGKWVCSYFMANHMREARPIGPPTPLISAQERAAILVAFSRGHGAGRIDAAPVPVQEIAAPSHVAAITLGARLNPKVVPAKLFQCSRLYGRKKKSSKFVYPPTKPART